MADRGLRYGKVNVCMPLPKRDVACLPRQPSHGMAEEGVGEGDLSR